MTRSLALRALFLCSLLSRADAFGQAPATPWRSDPLFQRLATTLDRVPAIDMHTHLVEPGQFDPEMANVGPLLLRATHPWLPGVVAERFGVVGSLGDWQAVVASIGTARAAMLQRLGEAGYWADHLDHALTEVALANQSTPEGLDGQRLLWVPYASTLLVPLPADRLMERSPAHASDIPWAQEQLRIFLKEDGRTDIPAELTDYLQFVDATLRRWQQQGAVGIKFYDAYLRTLRIADVPETQAAALYTKGRTTPLDRDEYLALQDHLWRHILLEAGEIGLPVHIHSSLGVPPFLRSLESDVRNLEDVLADPRFFATNVVLIHGGGPWYEIAAYLTAKPNVWADISSIAFLYPVPDMAKILRSFLIMGPEKLLYGTDAANYPSVPGGADVQHLILARATRDALYVALAGLVRDGVIDEPRALEMGRGVLRENARRLCGWSDDSGGAHP